REKSDRGLLAGSKGIAGGRNGGVPAGVPAHPAVHQRRDRRSENACSGVDRKEGDGDRRDAPAERGRGQRQPPAAQAQKVAPTASAAPEGVTAALALTLAPGQK